MRVARIVSILICMSVAAFGLSQIDIGGGGGGNPLPNTIILANPVSGITYNSISGFECQYAGFEAELQFLDQDNDDDVTNVTAAWSGSAGLTVDSQFTNQ